MKIQFSMTMAFGQAKCGSCCVLQFRLELNVACENDWWHTVERYRLNGTTISPDSFRSINRPQVTEKGNLFNAKNIRKSDSNLFENWRRKWILNSNLLLWYEYWRAVNNPCNTLVKRWGRQWSTVREIVFVQLLQWQPLQTVWKLYYEENFMRFFFE